MSELDTYYHTVDSVTIGYQTKGGGMKPIWEAGYWDETNFLRNERAIIYYSIYTRRRLNELGQ